jgi:hypothetical protein
MMSAELARSDMKTEPDTKASCAALIRIQRCGGSSPSGGSSKR